MKKFKSSLSVFVAALVAVLSVLPASAQKSDAEFSEPGFYGREILKTLGNSDALIFTYDRIVEYMENTDNIYEDNSSAAPKISVDISDDKYKISKDELKTVVDIYRRDHPEHFWFNAEKDIITWLNSASVAVQVDLYCYMGREDAAEAKKRVEESAARLITGITPEMSEFEREKLLHDRLAEKIVYDLSEPYAHSVYGALVNGRAVCDGYSESFQYLLRKVGIKAFTALGTGNGGNHAWNTVSIDGKYYNVDLTWDDQEKDTFYAYFNITDERINEDHAFADTVYKMPECNSTDANYFTAYGGAFNDFSVEGLGNLIKERGMKVHIYITGSTDNVKVKVDKFVLDLRENLKNRKILNAAEIFENAGCSYSVLGREVLLTIIITGDANCDGVIDIRDLISMKTRLSEGVTDTNKYWYLNLVPDNAIDSADLIMLRKKLLDIKN